MKVGWKPPNNTVFPRSLNRVAISYARGALNVMKEMPIRSASLSKSMGSTFSSMIRVSTPAGIAAATERLGSIENRNTRGPRGFPRRCARQIDAVGLIRSSLILSILTSRQGRALMNRGPVMFT